MFTENNSLYFHIAQFHHPIANAREFFPFSYITGYSTLPVRAPIERAVDRN